MRNKSKLVLLSFFSFLATSFTWGGVNGINYALYACDAPVTDLESIEYSQMNPFETGVCGQFYLDELNAVQWPSAFGYIVKYTGWYRVSRGISIDFSLTANNPSRLIVGSGSALTLQTDQAQGFTTDFGQLYLPAGYHPITVEYYTEDISTMDLEIASQAPGCNF